MVHKTPSPLPHANRHAHRVEQAEHLIVADPKTREVGERRQIQSAHLGAGKLRAAELCTIEDGLEQVAIGKVCIGQVGTGQIGFAKPAAGKRASGQFRLGEVDKIHLAGVKVRPCLDLFAAQRATEIDLGEFSASEVAVAHLDGKKLGSVEHGEPQVAGDERSALQVAEGKAAALAVFTGKAAILEANVRQFSMREAAGHEPAICKARVIEAGIGELDSLEDAVRERCALAIQFRPSIIDHPQCPDRLAGADFFGERVDRHLGPWREIEWFIRSILASNPMVGQDLCSVLPASGIRCRTSLRLYARTKRFARGLARAVFAVEG
nr:hypothetical protein [Bradyrhizobium sp.]